MTSGDLIPSSIIQLTQHITEVTLANTLNNFNWHKIQSNI